MVVLASPSAYICTFLLQYKFMKGDELNKTFFSGVKQILTQFYFEVALELKQVEKLQYIAQYNNTFFHPSMFYRLSS